MAKYFKNLHNSFCKKEVHFLWNKLMNQSGLFGCTGYIVAMAAVDVTHVAQFSWCLIVTHVGYNWKFLVIQLHPDY